MMQPDDNLVAAYLAGDAEAFEHLYARHAPRILGFVASLGGPRHLAEDVAQSAWLKALHALERYRPQGTFRAWLLQIAYREWLDQVRSARERKRAGPPGNGKAAHAPETALDAVEAPGPGPFEHAVVKETRGRIEAALDTMPGPMRQALLLRADAGLTFREIAEAMDCPLGTALWRVKEAERRLRQQLGAKV